MIEKGLWTEMEHRAARLGYASVEDWLRDLLDVPQKPAMPATKSAKPRPALKTEHGQILNTDSLVYMRDHLDDESVDLIVTSPPFCLLTQKEYGNEEAHEYLRWFSPFAAEFRRVLKPNGSLVIDLGSSWNRGEPTRNPYQFELLLQLVERHKFFLAQDIYWWNPGRIPGPAEWVTVRRVRLKDAVNTVWWMSRTPFPKSSNLRVLAPYSDSQNTLLKSGKFNAGPRPSGHDVSESGFEMDNGGAIPPNLLAIANTESNTEFQKFLKEKGLKPHPARFPTELPEFFIQMLTNKGDFVFDPFGGSCTTGQAAEKLERRWTCCELDEDYVEAAKGRFAGELPLARKLGPYQIPVPGLTNSEKRIAAHGGKQREKEP